MLPVKTLSIFRLGMTLGFSAFCMTCCFAATLTGIVWHEAAGCRWTELNVGVSGKDGFTRMEGAMTGIVFTNALANDRGITNRNLLSGSGVAAGDVDGDGLCDVYFCGLDSRNALYKNLGNWRFEDVTATAKVACEGQDSTGAVFADIDGDGDLDLLVNSLGNGLRVFENDGSGHFSEITSRAGVQSQNGGTSLALADIDGDGDLDLYVVNYRTTTIMDKPQTTFRTQYVDGKHVVAYVDGVSATAPWLTNRFLFLPTGEVIELGEPDILYINDGGGQFTPLPWTGGSFLDEDGIALAEPPRDWGLTVQMRDFTGDGAPDIYVCNDLFSPDRVWVNDGHGKFRAIERLALRTTSTFSMGIDFADINRDGHVDFMIVDMLATGHKDRHTQVSTQKPIEWPIGTIDNRPQVWRNTLQVNRGDCTFAEIAFYAGVEASNWSWMPLFLDVDLDGYEDVLVPTGQMRDFQNVDMQNRIDAERAHMKLTQADILRLLRMFPDFSTPGVAFRNNGNLTFEDKGRDWGWNWVGVSQGAAMADFDNDGDLDVMVNALNAQAGVYRNDSVKPRIAIRLRGAAGNTQGIGAQIKVLGGPVPQSQEVICGGHYLSGSDPLRVFACGTVTNALQIEVLWRSGRQSVITNAMPNRLYEIFESGAVPCKSPAKETNRGWFQDVSNLIGHHHHEDPFDDFDRQPLLPRKLSQLGPGIAWHDIDGDGWEDLIVPSGRGGRTAVMRNSGNGRFTPLEHPVLARPANRDQTTVLGVGSTLLIGLANYEDGLTNGGCIRIVDFRRGASGESVLGELASAGPLAMADVEGNGQLWIFVGGRVVPGRYPEAADSILLKTDRGRFTVAQRLTKVGLVSAAVFSDLDGNGTPELVLACEWGPVRVFRYEGQQYVEKTESFGLAGYLGWWTSVTTGDFDGDGRLDIMAGNWGLNNRYRRSAAAHPLRVYYGDIQERGGLDIIEARYVPELRDYAPDRGYIAVKAALPFVVERAPTFEAYGTMSLDQIYGEHIKQMRFLEVNTLETMLFLNREGKFEARKLPPEAQWAPVFGISIADFNGDGNEDAFLAQNFFAIRLDETRQDAGRGLLMLGDGRGNFTTVPGQQSGIKVYGEQRGCAVCDYDHDGRVDLAVTQNGNATVLYRNLVAKPGLRLAVNAGGGNPTGIGAVVRVGDDHSYGPAREIHAGSGYWSTDSPVQVVCSAKPLTRAWVRFPGGKTVVYDLPQGATSVELYPDGTVARR